MIWELRAFNTDRRYDDDIRYREYTSSGKKAALFEHIPKIQFSDSGHGIVFSAFKHQGKRKPIVRILDSYVREQFILLKTQKRINNV